jgi:hypothetical protein
MMMMHPELRAMREVGCRSLRRDQRSECER